MTGLCKFHARRGYVTTIFVGNYYEVNATTGEVTKYYYAGATRIAMRKQTVPENPQVTYLLGDHLGSTSIVTDDAGALLVETKYKPWGEVRYSTPDVTLPTRYSYTGQYSHMSDEATDLGNVGFGLMFYNARWYDPSLSRFAQADSIVPGGVQGYDRYAYVNNSPVNFNDPTGHWCTKVYHNTGTTAISDVLCPDPPVNIWNTNAGASQKGVKFIKDQEKYFSTPYDDSRGNCTIGWGHMLSRGGGCSDAQLNTDYSDKQFQDWFEEDLAAAEKAVRREFQQLDNIYRPNPPFSEGNPVPIDQSQFDALVSLAFNGGPGAVYNVVRDSARPVYGSSKGTFDNKDFATVMMQQGVFYDSRGNPIKDGVYYRRLDEIELFINGNY